MAENNKIEPTEKEIEEFFDHLKNPEMNISEEELRKLKHEMTESISMDRQKLICRMPFVGGMLMHFEIRPVRSWKLATASTDGSRIFFDMDFYAGLNEDERLFVLAHECWHCVYLHFLRRQGRNSELWNVATDCEINYMLNKQGFISPKDLCYPDKEDEGKSAEEIYERLLRKMKKNKQMSDGGDANGGNGTYGKNHNKDEKERGSDDRKNKSKSGGKSGLSGQFDKHTDKDTEEDGGYSEHGLPKDRWGEKGDDTDYRPLISSDVAERIRESIISEAQKYERKQGKLPGDIDVVIDRFRKPEISWKEILCQEVTKCYADRREWLPPNRRYVHRGLYIPSRHGEKVKCTVAIDTSGSTTADIPKFMGELTGLLNSFSNYEMKLIQCDAEIQSVEDYDDCNPFPLEDCSKIKFKGFGGTSFVPVFDYLRDDCEDDTNLLIYFTDSYGDAPKDPPPYPVLWVLTSDSKENSNFCSWGKKMWFKEKTDR